MTVQSLWLLALLVVGPAGPDEALPDLRLLALSPASAAAVVEVPGEVEGEAEGDGDGLHVVHPGDSIGETGLQVVGVLPDRLEVVLSVPGGPGVPAMRRRFWIYRAEGATASRAQPLDRSAPPPRRVGSSYLSQAPHDAPPRARSGGDGAPGSVRSRGASPPDETESPPEPLPPPAPSAGEPE